MLFNFYKFVDFGLVLPKDSKIYPTVTEKMQLLHLSTESSMPGASVGDPYHRQYQIYGQSISSEAAEL